jgi:hypothetical protein
VRSHDHSANGLLSKRKERRRRNHADDQKHRRLFHRHDANHNPAALPQPRRYPRTRPPLNHERLHRHTQVRTPRRQVDRSSRVRGHHADERMLRQRLEQAHARIDSLDDSPSAERTTFPSCTNIGMGQDGVRQRRRTANSSRLPSHVRGCTSDTRPTERQRRTADGRRAEPHPSSARTTHFSRAAQTTASGEPSRGMHRQQPPAARSQWCDM